ncbi:MAG: hypothetical protein VKK62_04900, partial [Synechococcaceae cyanobacterium]|nr:hypothetical protein [Synechococcaceae cyanobacterium]
MVQALPPETPEDPEFPEPLLPRRPWLDTQGFTTLIAGSLLLLISFITNYGHDDIFQIGSLPVDEQ